MRPVNSMSADPRLIANLKEHAGLEKDIVLVGAVNKIEIWDVTKYKKFFESISPEAFSKLANEVIPTGLDIG